MYLVGAKGFPYGMGCLYPCLFRISQVWRVYLSRGAQFLVLSLILPRNALLFVLVWPSHSACLLLLSLQNRIVLGQGNPSSLPIVLLCCALSQQCSNIFSSPSPVRDHCSISSRVVTSPGPLSRTYFGILRDARTSRMRALRVTAFA